jgi:hypothetical protein
MGNLVTKAKARGTRSEIPVEEDGEEVDQIKIIPAYAFCDTAFTSTSVDETLRLHQPVCIGEGAFSYCDITSVYIPSSVKRIGEGAFRGCTALTSVYIPSSVTQIDDDAFRGCTALTSADVPLSAKLGESVFKECKSLTSMNWRK